MVVAVACGRVVGMTFRTAVFPAELTDGGLTEATPAVFARSVRMVVSSELVAWEDSAGNFTTTLSGPFTPTPNPWLRRS